MPILRPPPPRLRIQPAKPRRVLPAVAIPGLSDGNVYSWSFASQESGNNLQGPFATDFVFTAQQGPSVVVNGPSGISPTAQPTFVWTPTVVGAQTTFRICLYRASQYNAAGFVPGLQVSGIDGDSGVIASAATSWLSGFSFVVNGTTYRVYVQIAQTGGQLSAWAYSQFTVAFNAPAIPVLSGTYDSTNARSILNVQGRDNLLTADDASFETTVGSWVADTNMGAPIQTVAQALDGSFSCRLRSSAAGDMIARSGEYIALPSTQYTFLNAFRAAVSARNCQVGVEWRDSSHVIIGSRAFGSTAGDSAAGWTNPLSILTATSPSNAAYLVVLARVQVTGGASEDHYQDEVSFAPGASTTWTRGGLVGASSTLIEYSDDAGVTWATVRGAGAVSIPSPSETVATAYDYEVPPYATRSYRATIMATGLAGAPSSALNLSNPGGFWLKDPVDPTANLMLWLSTESDPSYYFNEQVQSFKALGRSQPVVLADTVLVMTRGGTIVARVKNNTDLQSLLTITLRQKALLLQLRDQKYIRIVGRAVAGPDLGNRYDVTLQYVQVDAP